MKLLFLFKANASDVYWVWSDGSDMWVRYDYKTAMRIENLLVHFFVKGIRELVTVELEVLGVARIVKIKPEHINLELMIWKLPVSFDHFSSVDRCPFAEVETQTIGWWHIGITSNISKAFLSTLRSKLASKHKELHSRRLGYEVYKRCVSIRMILDDVNPGVSAIHPSHTWITAFTMTCQIWYTTIQIGHRIFTVRK